MITKPPIDTLAKRAGNKYILCCAISKRAKELNIRQEKDEFKSDIKTISYAANELMEDKIKITKE